jgi:transcriptional antiterminator RfaH
VRFNNYPVPVRDEIVEGIRSRLSQPEAQEPYLKAGERVQITEGPFSHVEAIFVAHDGAERVVVLMNILQQDQTVTFPLRSVRKLG